MTAVDFPQANVKTIPSFRAKIGGGRFDDGELIVVAWRPSIDDLDRLIKGEMVYLTAFGGLPPHFVSTTFKEATQI